MPLTGRYEPSTFDWVRDQVDLYERTDGRDGALVDGRPIVILTTVGARSGVLRKSPVMRFREGETYAAVGSVGGRPQNPSWYHNLLADPHCTVQDGPTPRDMVAREAHGEERQRWWDEVSTTWPHYAEMQAKTTRPFPIMLLEPDRD